MSHLFNTFPYIQFSLHNHANLKKLLQSRIQAATQTITDDLHTIQAQQQTSIDQNTCLLYYQGQQVLLPSKLLQSQQTSPFLTQQILLQNLTQQQKSILKKYLPQNLQKHQPSLSDIFTLKNLNGLTPFQNFEKQFKKGYFTLSRQKQDQILQQLSLIKLKQIYINIYNIIRQRLQQQKYHTQKFIYRNQQSQLQSLQDLQSRVQVSDNSQITLSQQQNNYDQYQQYQNQIFYRYDYTKQKLQQQLLTIGEDRGQRKIVALKNVITVKPRNSQWVQNFRKQQYQRYSSPTKPWMYICQDGRKVTVAPVAKKLSVLAGKPRYHAMLKNQRPACVTILTLARDAAARLPNGVGTRADICQLVKQSQYINQDLPEQKLSSTISGALDRLHYMDDACVKYDSQKKLWIYLHMDRNHEHPGWGDDGEQYTQKNSAKKKKTVY